MAGGRSLVTLWEYKQLMITTAMHKLNKIYCWVPGKMNASAIMPEIIVLPGTCV